MLSGGSEKLGKVVNFVFVQKGVLGPILIGVTAHWCPLAWPGSTYCLTALIPNLSHVKYVKNPGIFPVI